MNETFFKKEHLSKKPEAVYPDSPAIARIYHEMNNMQRRYEKKIINPDLVALVSTAITLVAFFVAPFYGSWIVDLFK
jgi:hypothetical protein